MTDAIEWKEETIDAYTTRVKVFGGWIVKHTEPVTHIVDYGMANGWDVRLSTTFVPDPYHKWEILLPNDVGGA